MAERGSRDEAAAPREAAELTEPQVLLASRSPVLPLSVALQHSNGREGGIRFQDRVPLLPQYFINNIRNYLIAVHPVTPEETH
jgi:hypothetical protein